METDLERMYRAGKDYIPAAAERLRHTSARFHDLLATLDKQAGLAGDPSVLRNMLMVGGDTYDVVRGGVTNLYHCAEAVVSTETWMVETSGSASIGSVRAAQRPAQSSTTSRPRTAFRSRMEARTIFSSMLYLSGTARS